MQNVYLLDATSQFNDAKMAHFCSFVPSSLLSGGMGDNCLTLFCPRLSEDRMALQEAIFAMQITSGLLSQA